MSYYAMSGTAIERSCRLNVLGSNYFSLGATQAGTKTEIIYEYYDSATIIKYTIDWLWEQFKKIPGLGPIASKFDLLEKVFSKAISQTISKRAKEQEKDTTPQLADWVIKGIRDTLINKTPKWDPVGDVAVKESQDSKYERSYVEIGEIALWETLFGERIPSDPEKEGRDGEVWKKLLQAINYAIETITGLEAKKTRQQQEPGVFDTGKTGETSLTTTPATGSGWGAIMTAKQAQSMTEAELQAYNERYGKYYGTGPRETVSREELAKSYRGTAGDYKPGLVAQPVIVQEEGGLGLPIFLAAAAALYIFMT